jgi:hypothetical protein
LTARPSDLARTPRFSRRAAGELDRTIQIADRLGMAGLARAGR